MNRPFLILLALILGFNIIHSQDNLTENQKLFATAKVWGFLKYYHPQVATGNFNWDNQLFNIIPKVTSTTSQDEFSSVLLNWINSLGEIPICKRCKNENGDYFNQNFDLTWINSSEYFSKDLSNRLSFIKNNRSQGHNYYFAPQPVGKIKVTNEPIYGNLDSLQEKHRLLELFRFWNIIEYFYPYKYLADQDWDEILLQMIPKFQKQSNKIEYQQLVKELVVNLDDAHANAVFDNEIIDYLPIKIKLIENKPVVSGFFNDSIGKANGFELGDIILKVNDVDIDQTAREKFKYTRGSNTEIKKLYSYYNVLKGRDSIVDVTLCRGADTLQITGKRYAYKNFNHNKSQQGEKWKLINDSIGYMNMAYIKGYDVKDIMKNLMDKKAIIIDLRNYPAYIYWLVSRYINKEKRDFARIYAPDVTYPGKFKFKKNSKTGVKNKKGYSGKVIILVDDESISRSEYTIMAFQTAENVITVGSQTVGADGDVASYELVGGGKVYYTGIGVLYPDGSESQRKGVKIDKIVKPTINGIREGRDEVLEKAIEIASN